MEYCREQEAGSKEQEARSKKQEAKTRIHASRFPLPAPTTALDAGT